MIIYILLSLTHLTMPYNGKLFSAGTAFSTNKETPENLFWNPAGMGENAYIASAFHYSGLIFGSFGKTIELKSQNFGFGFQVLRSETITKTNMMGEEIGTFNYQSIVPLIAVNFEIRKITIGTKVCFPYTNVDEYQNFGLGLDLGAIYSPLKSLSFSVYARNIGREIKTFVSEKENFPAEFRLGGLFEFDKTTFSLEYSTLFGVCSSISYDLNKILGLTTGYNRKIGRFSGTETSELAGLSFGVNIRHKKMNISIGTIMCGPEGISETLSISFIP